MGSNSVHRVKGESSACGYCVLQENDQPCIVPTPVILWKKARKTYLCLSLCRGSEHGVPEFCMNLYPYSSLHARVLNQEVGKEFVKQTMFCPITCFVTSF